MSKALSNMVSKIINNKRTFVLYVIFFMTFLTTILLTYLSYPLWLNSDMSAEIIAAKKALQEGSLLSKNWYYGTELRLITPTLLYQFFLLFTNDFWLIRCLTIPIVLIILFLSLFFFIKQFGYKEYFPIVGTLMLVPLGAGSYYFAYVISGYQMYAFYYSLMFITMGLLMKVIKRENKTKTIIYLIILGLIAFLLGVNSVRHLAMAYLPLVCTTGLIALVKFIKVKNKSFFRTRSFFCFSISIGLLLFNFLGVLINQKVLANEYSFFSYPLKFVLPGLTDFKETFSFFFQCLGYTNESGFFNVLSNITMVLLTLYLLGFIIFYIFNYKKLRFEDNLLVIFFFVSLGAIFFFFLFITNVGNWRIRSTYYFLIPLAYLFSLLPILMKNLSFNRLEKHKLQIIEYSTLSVFFVITLFSYRNFYKPFRTNEGIIEVANIISDTNLKYGYASNYNGKVLTELTKQQVEIYNWQSSNNEVYEMKEVQEKEHDDFIIRTKCFAVFHNDEINLNPFKRIIKNENCKLIQQTKNFYIFELPDGNAMFNGEV